MNELVDQVAAMRAKLDWIEEVALAASTDNDHDVVEPRGVKWRWVAGATDDDEPVPARVVPLPSESWKTVPCVGDYENDDEVTLESVDEYPLTAAAVEKYGLARYPMLGIVLASEVAMGTGAHVATWDPRRVITLVSATRLMLDMYDRMIRIGEDTDAVAAMISVFAMAWLANS